MSQQDNSQDSPDTPPVPAEGAWSETPATNRPAEGATRVESLNQVEQTWNAGAAATDFLGLEQDAPAEAPGLAPAAAADPAAAPNPTQAWLFHMESESRAAFERGAAGLPAEAAAASEWKVEVGSDPATESEFGPEDPAAPLAEPVAAGLAADASPELQAEIEAAQTAPKSGSKRQWLIAAGLAAVLLAAGGWQYWSGKSKPATTSDPIAWRSGNKTKKPTPTEKPPQETPVVAKTPVETPPGVPQVTPTPPESAPTELASTNPPAGDPAAPLEPQPAPDEPLAQIDPQPEPTDFTPVPFSGTRPEEPLGALATPKGTRRPDPSEISGLWTDRAIPFDAIDAETMLHTPRVGAVRVLLKNGEHLQGRLHSVGQGHVRMDISLGRMSVDFSEVREIVQILEADLSKKPSGGLPEETAGLLYVTAKVPGGYLTGWLVQRTGGKLTLITEQAKKVTFDDEGFEPVSKGRARVVGSIGREATEAKLPAKASAAKPTK